MAEANSVFWGTSPAPWAFGTSPEGTEQTVAGDGSPRNAAMIQSLQGRHNIRKESNSCFSTACEFRYKFPPMLGWRLHVKELCRPLRDSLFSCFPGTTVPGYRL